MHTMPIESKSSRKQCFLQKELHLKGRFAVTNAEGIKYTVVIPEVVVTPEKAVNDTIHIFIDYVDKAEGIE